MRRAAQRCCGLLLRQHVSCLEITRNSIAGQADLFLALRAASQVSSAARKSQHRWQDHSFFQPRAFQSWSAVHQLATSPSTASKNDNKDEVKSPLENQKEVSLSTPSATPGAQLCDAVLDHLRATKSKVERNQTGETTWRQRAITVKNALITGTMVVVKFTFAIPGAITRHIALPWADKLNVYKGWWTTIKKEAHHYWVSAHGVNYPGPHLQAQMVCLILVFASCLLMGLLCRLVSNCLLLTSRLHPGLSSGCFKAKTCQGTAHHYAACMPP